MNELTKDEILQAVGPGIRLSHSARRTKPTLIEAVSVLDDDCGIRIEEAVRKKRKRVDDEHHFSVPHGMVDEDGIDLFMCPAREDEMQAILRRFRDATSKKALEHKICGICARRLMMEKAKFELFDIRNVPNRQRLRVVSNEDGQEAIDGLLLERAGRGGFNPDTLQSGLKGNVMTYELNSQRIVEMLEGRLFPRPTCILADLISVTYVGLGRLPKNWLQSTFRVRRFHVGRALEWLKQHNPRYYGDIEIDMERLSRLPLDDVPEEILALIRQETDIDVIDRESAGAIVEEEGDNYDNEDPDVVPLRFLGSHDVDLTDISSSQMLEWGLANLWSEGKEGGYAVRHGIHPMNEFPTGREDDNLWEKTYPTLFPYGVGGFEHNRRRSISLNAHMEWCLDYYDGRFCKHGVQQKRRALISAHFDHDASILSSITIGRLKKAADEESHQVPISDDAVRLLRKHVYASAGRLPGQIWGIVWITINPDDLHNPIAQIFCGEDINMDDFSKLSGPTKSKRATKYFHFIVDLIFRILFGIRVAHGGRIIAERGIFVVESQGRGTLHLHALLWLKGAPSTDTMQALLQTEEFRERIRRFGDTQIQMLPTDAEVSYARQPDPDSDSYGQDARELAFNVLRTKQIHTCSTATCLQMKKGVLKCKHRAPWPVCAKSVVTPSGEWHPKRSYPFMNASMPAITETLMANNDISLLLNGRETLNLSFYATTYATKKQSSSYNLSSLLAEHLAYHFEDEHFVDELKERQRLLIFQQELAGPMIVSYQKTWGDVYRSHNPVKIYWSSFLTHLLREDQGLLGERCEFFSCV
ncbi:hypothetical protein BKA93DRAFT_852784 [Sparassis latifolia]